MQDIVGIEAIINRVVVHDDYDTQMRWLNETNKDFEIENMIIVGGESSKVNYPGPTVNEALNAISNIYNQEAGDIFLRRHSNSKQERGVKKSPKKERARFRILLYYPGFVRF